MKVQTFFRRWRVTVPAVVLAAGALTLGFWSTEDHLSASAPAVATATAAPAIRAVTATASYADAVEKASPAVVTVRVEAKAQADQMQLPDNPFFRRFFGPGQMPQQPQIEEGVGSGVIMNTDGTIITNNHVVENADRVEVTLPDGRAFTAKVVGTDPQTDLAVIHIDADNLKAITVADSDSLRVGDVVLAVGNPLDLGQTVTMGIISAKGRTTSIGSADNPSAEPYENFLQTDAAINRGNSGGALVTTNGDLVGINSQIVSPSGGNIGIGFAIPSNMVRNVMAQLITTGHVRRGKLGVLVQSITSDLAKSLNLPSVHGALVSSVEPDSPAAKAGVKQGDVVLRVNGTAVNDSNDLRNRISGLAPGTSVQLDVMRNGSEQHLTVTLGEMNPSGESASSSGQSSSHGQLGMSLQAVTPAVASRLQLPSDTTGVAITDVDPAGPAARAGLRSGEVILKVNGQDVHTPTEVQDAVTARKGQPSLLLIEFATQGQVQMGYRALSPE